jgi:hypothetical protein
MAKPQKPTRVVPSDDCWVTEAGERFNPHEGETVTVLKGWSIGALHSLQMLRRAPVEVAAVKGEENEGGKIADVMDAAFMNVCAELAHRVVEWTWTDDLGRPLPPLDGSTAPFLHLRTDELYWLIGACQGESSVEKKDGSKSSPTTS